MENDCAKPNLLEKPRLVVVDQMLYPNKTKPNTTATPSAAETRYPYTRRGVVAAAVVAAVVAADETRRATQKTRRTSARMAERTETEEMRLRRFETSRKSVGVDELALERR